MPKIQDSQLFFTLRDISTRYRIPLSTLRRWASERRFPLYKVSTRIFVSIKDWEDWWGNFYAKGGGDHD